MKTLLFTFSLLFASCITAFAQPSFLDSTFGNNGIVITPVGTSSNNDFTTVVVQPDNKIIAGGIALGKGILIRYNEDGSFDNTFATSGIFTQSNIWETAIALQTDGKIIAIGGGGLTTRFNINGTLDSTFGIGGIDSTSFDSVQFGGSAISLQPDGKIVIAGQTNSNSIGVARLLPNGMPDSTFGINGIVTSNSWGTWAYGWTCGVSILPDGRIVIGAETTLYGFMVIRCLSNGAPDTSFNHNGVAINYAGDSYNYCNAMQLQPDGKVVLAGTGDFGITGGDFTLLRYNIDGSLDRSFGDTGVVNIDFNEGDDEAGSLYITFDEKIIVAGYATIATNADFALTRINDNGSIDTFFGNNGRITTAIQDSADIARALAVQQDGKIVLAGWSVDNIGKDELTIARYISFTTAIQQITHQSNNVDLYPNPTTTKLFIKGDKIHIINITAFDFLGKEMDIGAYPPYSEIYINKWTDGIYFFKISFDDRPPIVQKILIENNN